MADFQHRLISGIFGVFFELFFAHNFSNVNTDSILTIFREVKFLAQIQYFAKAMAPCKGYSLSKMADFQQRLVSGIFGVFSSVFSTELIQCEHRIAFDMF